MKLILKDRLPFIESENGVLFLNTGSPVSFCDTGCIQLGEDTHQVSQRYLTSTIDRVSDLTNLDIRGQIGMDILSNYSVLVDYASCRFETNPQLMSKPSVSIDLKKMMEMPCIQIHVQNEVVNSLLHTGAPLGFLYSRRYGRGAFESFNGIDYHYAFADKYYTPMYHVPWKIRDLSFTGDFIHMPDVFEYVTFSDTQNGVQFILGYDFFNNAKVVMDFLGGTIHIQSNNESFNSEEV